MLREQIEKLLSQRAEITAKMRALHERAEKLKTEFTSDEKQQWGDWKAKVDEIDQRVERLKGLQAADERFGDRQPAKSTADPDDCPLELDARGNVNRPLRPDESFSRLFRHAGRYGHGRDFERQADERNGLIADQDEQPAFRSIGQYVRAAICGPSSDLEARALAEGTDSAGGYTVPVILANEVIDAMRAKAKCVRAGARTIPLQTSVTSFAKLATDPAPAWRAENAAVAESEPTFGVVTMTPKSLACRMVISQELLADSPNGSQMITKALSGAFAAALDAACLMGTGASNQPTGLYSMSNVNIIKTDPDGFPLVDWTPIQDGWQLLMEANADVSDNFDGEQIADANNGYHQIMSPREMVTLDKLTTALGPQRLPFSMLGSKRFATTAIPTNITWGASTDASALFMGDWRELWIGLRQQLTIQILKERYMDNLQYGIVASLRADVQCAHEESFVVIKSITA